MYANSRSTPSAVQITFPHPKSNEDVNQARLTSGLLDTVELEHETNHLATRNHLFLMLIVLKLPTFTLTLLRLSCHHILLHYFPLLLIH